VRTSRRAGQELEVSLLRHLRSRLRSPESRALNNKTACDEGRRATFSEAGEESTLTGALSLLNYVAGLILHSPAVQSVSCFDQSYTDRHLGLLQPAPFCWSRKRVPNGYERCPCCSWGCRYQIFDSLKLFHFASDRNETK